MLRVDGLARCREIEAVRDETFFPLLPVVVPEPATDAELITQRTFVVSALDTELAARLAEREGNCL